jgi:hypothetical protein
MVIALAGRRVDAPKADTACFPPANVTLVRKRISDWFAEHAVHTLVCSAASGVDLLALDVSEELGIHRCIVLPFPREQFRGTSVVDRNGDWGKQFDEILNIVESQDNVFVLGYAPENETAYLATNHTILELAISIGTRLDRTVGGVVVWDGASRGDDDVTAAFQQEARGRGLVVEELSTL